MSRYRDRGYPSTTLYIRNVSDKVRYDDVRRLFSKYGRIVDVTIPLDYYSGLPKGYCFVEFEDHRDAEEAQYRMDRQRLFGREIEVEFSRGARKTPSEMRNRDRDSRRYSSRSDSGRASEDYYNGRSNYSRSRSRGRGDRARGSPDRDARPPRSSNERNTKRSKSREPSYTRAKKSRASRSYSKHRSPSPPPAHEKSMSRERSRSRSRSVSSRSSVERSQKMESPRGSRDSRSSSRSRSRSGSPE